MSQLPRIIRTELLIKNLIPQIRLASTSQVVEASHVPESRSAALLHPRPSAPLSPGGTTDTWWQFPPSILCPTCSATQPGPQNRPVFGHGSGSCPDASAWWVRRRPPLLAHVVDVGAEDTGGEAGVRVWVRVLAQEGPDLQTCRGFPLHCTYSLYLLNVLEADWNHSGRAQPWERDT